MDEGSGWLDTLWKYGFPILTISYFIFDLRKRKKEREDQNFERRWMRDEVAYLRRKLERLEPKTENQVKPRRTSQRMNDRDRAWVDMMSLYGSVNR